MEEIFVLNLILPGAPRTKKNSGRIVPRGGRHIILPSEAWQKWCDLLAPALRAKLAAMGFAPIAQPVNCRALFFRDADRGDAVGFIKASPIYSSTAGPLPTTVGLSHGTARAFSSIATTRESSSHSPQ